MLPQIENRLGKLHFGTGGSQAGIAVAEWYKRYNKVFRHEHAARLVFTRRR